MIGKPRTKDEAELAWSAVKRAVSARVNYEAQVWRERELNARLEEAWESFKLGLEDDRILSPSAEDLKAIGPGRDK